MWYKLLIAACVLVLSFFLYTRYSASPQLPTDYKKAQFTIEGKPISIIDLQRAPEVPQIASQINTYYFGNDVRHDLNGDGKDDVAFLVQRYFADGQILYYAVAALSQGDGYVGSDGYLLGDRIAPQTTEMRENNIVVVNFAERRPKEPATVQPSVGRTVMLKIDPVTLQWGIVAQNFEGEADPRLMFLGMKTWGWQRASYNDGQDVTPKQAEKFTLTFKKDGTFSATTDCNAVSGTYMTTKSALTFGPMAATKMFCANAEERLFSEILATAESYRFTTKGELIIDLRSKSGNMTFK